MQTQQYNIKAPFLIPFIKKMVQHMCAGINAKIDFTHFLRRFCSKRRGKTSARRSGTEIKASDAPSNLTKSRKS